MPELPEQLVGRESDDLEPRKDKREIGRELLADPQARLTSGDQHVHRAIRLPLLVATQPPAHPAGEGPRGGHIERDLVIRKVALQHAQHAGDVAQIAPNGIGRSERR